MIWKRCPRCRKRIPEGTTCTCIDKDARTSSHNRQRVDGIRHEYHTTRWDKERAACLNTYDHVDLYALYHDGQVAAAEVVHHIEPILQRPELFHATDNHFPCSVRSHAMIHYRYDHEDADAVKDELRGYLRRYHDEVING